MGSSSDCETIYKIVHEQEWLAAKFYRCLSRCCHRFGGWLHPPLFGRTSQRNFSTSFCRNGWLAACCCRLEIHCNRSGMGTIKKGPAFSSPLRAVAHECRYARVPLATESIGRAYISRYFFLKTSFAVPTRSAAATAWVLVPNQLNLKSSELQGTENPSCECAAFAVPGNVKSFAIEYGSGWTSE